MFLTFAKGHVIHYQVLCIYLHSPKFGSCTRLRHSRILINFFFLYSKSIQNGILKLSLNGINWIKKFMIMWKNITCFYIYFLYNTLIISKWCYKLLLKKKNELISWTSSRLHDLITHRLTVRRFIMRNSIDFFSKIRSCEGHPFFSS